MKWRRDLPQRKPRILLLKEKSHLHCTFGEPTPIYYIPMASNAFSMPLPSRLTFLRPWGCGWSSPLQRVDMAVCPGVYKAAYTSLPVCAESGLTGLLQLSVTPAPGHRSSSLCLGGV